MLEKEECPSSKEPSETCRFGRVGGDASSMGSSWEDRLDEKEYSIVSCQFLPILKVLLSSPHSTKSTKRTERSFVGIRWLLLLFKMMLLLLVVMIILFCGASLALEIFLVVMFYETRKCR